MIKRLLLSLLFACAIQSVSLRAQDLFINADFVTSFIWRGMKCEDTCLQPTLGYTAKGFTFFAWGSTNFNTYGSHVDLFANYKYKGLKFEVADYFVLSGPDDQKNYFDYDARTTNHSFDGIVSYELSPKCPLTFTWSTIFAGADYNNANGKRSYSSYFEVAYPFSIKEFDLCAEVGMTPWEGMYANKANVVNIGLSAKRTIKINDLISFPVSGKLVFNPYEEKSYFVFGVHF